MYIIKVKGVAKIPDYVQLRDSSFTLLAYFRVDRPGKALEKVGLGEKMDEILERIDKEDIAFVITEGGRNKAVICPCRWFEETFPEEIGGTIVSAIRYELSAESENADAVRQFAMKHRVVLDEHTRSEVIREIEIGRASCRERV